MDPVQQQETAAIVTAAERRSFRPVPPHPARYAPREERIFFSVSSVVMILVIAYGFAPSFYLRGALAPRYPMAPMIPLVMLHGVLFTAWLLLFASQTWLAAAGRIDLHRKIGTAGFVLLPCMVLVATLVALGGVGRPLTAPEGIDPLSWLAVPLLGVPLFGALMALGLANRNRPRIHKRYLYVAMASMMGPGFGRMDLPDMLSGPVAQIGLPGLFLLALMAWDLRSLGYVHRATWAGSAAVLAVEIVTPLIWTTPAWLEFADLVAAPFR